MLKLKFCQTTTTGSVFERYWVECYLMTQSITEIIKHQWRTEEYGALVEWQWEGKIEVHGGKTVPEPLGPPQISNVLSWDRTQDSTAQRHLSSKLLLTYRQWYCSLHGQTANTFLCNVTRQGKADVSPRRIVFNSTETQERFLVDKVVRERVYLREFGFFSAAYHSPKSAYLSVITGWLKRPIWGRSINSVGLNINFTLVRV